MSLGLPQRCRLSSALLVFYRLADYVRHCTANLCGTAGFIQRQLLASRGRLGRVAAIDPDTNRLAAERLTDAARVVFARDYVGDHATLGYAATVHSAQGVTGERCYAHPR
jgi:hypothetical protein